MKPPWILHNYPVITHESMYHTVIMGISTDADCHSIYY